jgi:hypothetical protein
MGQTVASLEAPGKAKRLNFSPPHNPKNRTSKALEQLNTQVLHHVFIPPPTNAGGSYFPVLQYLCMKQSFCAGETGDNYKPNFLSANLYVLWPSESWFMKVFCIAI